MLFFFKQKRAYELRIRDWSSDVCSSDLVPRPEISGTMQTYIDLHRHAAVREALTGHPKVALRLMVAHAIVGSYLWRVKPERQTCRNEAVRERVQARRAEDAFDEGSREVLGAPSLPPPEPTVAGTTREGTGRRGVVLAPSHLPGPP